ncbi:MAG: GNAT family protein [Burkholderiaceae bacterium]
MIGCRSQHQSLELKRMVVQAKGQGYGRAALRVAKRVAFDDLHAHRFWLDVKLRNGRAQAFYDSEGFVVEGTLRDAVRIRLEDGKAGFDSLVVWSMLQTEFSARRAQGLELVA